MRQFSSKKVLMPVSLLLLLTGCGGGGDGGGDDTPPPPPPPDPGTEGRVLWLPASAEGVLHGYSGVQLRGDANQPGAITLTGAGSAPFGTVFDSDGNLWVSDYLGNALLIYTADQITASGDQTPAASITDDGLGALDGPVGLAFDGDGNLWVGNYEGNTLVQYTAQQVADALAGGGPSNPTPPVIISSGILNGPYGHAFDTQGNLWVGNNLGDNVLKFTPGQLAASGSPAPAAVTSATNSGSLDAARGPAFDADGDLWVSSRRTNQLVQYNIDQNGNPVPLTTTNITLQNGSTPAAPAGIAFDGAGNLWLTESVADQLLRYVTADLEIGNPTPAARTIEGFGTFGAIGGVLISFDPPPDGLPLAR